MYEAVFRAVIKEKTLYTRQSKPSLLKTVASRLSLCASVFRLAVEQGVQHIKSKTFKALSKHIVDILPYQGERLCEPISLDYIKALRVCLEYSPHAEHMDREEWGTLAKFCCIHVESQLGILGEEPVSGDEDMETGDNHTPRKSWLSLSLEDSSGSRRTVPISLTNAKLKHDCEELMLCLGILLRQPNAPIVEHDEMVCKTIIGFLTLQPSVTRAHQPAFSALNSTLEASTTNNLALSSKVTQAIVPVVAKMWDSKSPTLREQMMITLIYIQPHIRTILSGGGSRSLRRKVEGLSEVLFVEYSGRADRDQLQLDDVAFPDPRKPFDAETTPLGLRAFCLRRGFNPRAEQSWAVPQLIAAMTNALDRSDEGRRGPEDKAPEEAPAKRRRISKRFDELMRNTRSMIASRKLCALQTLPFMIAERDMESDEFGSVLLDLFNACSDDSSVISSWAMLSIARWGSYFVAPLYHLALSYLG